MAATEWTGFELRARGLRVACFAGCAPCERGSADTRCAAGIPSIAQIMPGTPSQSTSSGSAASRRRMWKNSGQLSVFFVLRAAPRRCGAECGKVRRGTVDRGLWGRRVGLARLMAARIAGCDPIIAFDPLPNRLVLARELGATRENFGRDLHQLVMDEV